MELTVPVLYSQKHVAEPYPESDQFRQHLHKLFDTDSFQDTVTLK
jgi:hypothetical protein